MLQNMSCVCIVSLLFIPPTAARHVVKIFAMHGSRCHCIHGKGRLCASSAAASTAASTTAFSIWGEIIVV